MTQEEEHKRQLVITQNTLIPIGLLGVLAGGIWWFTSLYQQVRSIDMRLKDTESKVTLFQESSITTVERLVTIEVKLDELKSSLSNSTIKSK